MVATDADELEVVVQCSVPLLSAKAFLVAFRIKDVATLFGCWSGMKRKRT